MKQEKERGSCDCPLFYNYILMVLKSELITNSQLDNIVLEILCTLYGLLVNLHQAKVVAGVNHDGNSRNLIGNAQGDGNVNLLTF